MPLPFDASLKDLAQVSPRGLLATFDAATALPVSLLNVDLSTVTTAADVVFGLGQPLQEIIHLDFSRVSFDESIETEVRLEVRGDAKGVADGGTLEVLVHDLKVNCRANAIPDSLRVDVSKLGLGQAIHVKDLVLPEGVTIHAEGGLLLIHVVAPGSSTAAAEVETATQPEVIKPERKEKED